MINYHVVIAAERRVSTPAAPRELACPVAGQLHTMGKSILNLADPNIVYAASWDGVSPWIVVLKGTIASLKMGYAGWPMVDHATWKAANPVKVI